MSDKEAGINQGLSVATVKDSYGEINESDFPTIHSEDIAFLQYTSGSTGNPKALSLNTLADVVLDEGEFGDARPLLDESLEINRDLGDQTAIAYLIEDYAGLAAAETKPQKALQLAGFASALRESIGAPLPPSEQARVDRMLAPARESLPEPTAAAEWEIGRSLKLEQAIELALATD